MDNLYDIYTTLPTNDFKAELLRLIESGPPPNLDDIIKVTEEDDDMEILGLINELIFAHKPFYERDLISELDTEYNYRTKATIINVLTSHPTPLAINSLTENYIEGVENRPIIEKRLFSNKQLLTAALLVYCDRHPSMDAEKKALIRSLLKRIPITTLQRFPTLGRSLLFYIYQTIPPLERYEEVKARNEYKEIIDEET